MALQDLTPQLRTRMSRVERIVGVFVVLATLLLLSGFGYYLYNTAKNKGWFKTKAPYFTFVESATGLKVGDPVKLMGFNVGEITVIEAMPADDPMFNVYVEFVIVEPYYGYLWTDSKAKVTTGDFLGNRSLEVTKGTTGTEIYRVKGNEIIAVWRDRLNAYVPYTNHVTKPYWLLSEESPALTKGLDTVVSMVKTSLPAIFSLTNQVATVLSNSAQLLARLDSTVNSVQPAITNVTQITAQLTDPQGSLGTWLIPTQLNNQLQDTLNSAQSVMQAGETNLNMLSASINTNLVNLAGITSNLHNQVQANSMILSEISTLVVEADEFLQGLKRNWLLRSAFSDSGTQALESMVEPRIRGAR